VGFGGGGGGRTVVVVRGILMSALMCCRVTPGYDVIGSIVVFFRIGAVSRSMRAFGIFFNELGPKGSLQDGEERLVVDCFHDQGGAGLIAIWEGEVVDAHTPFTAILLEGVSCFP
jgi:hypothetical protein